MSMGLHAGGRGGGFRAGAGRGRGAGGAGGTGSSGRLLSLLLRGGSGSDRVGGAAGTPLDCRLDSAKAPCHVLDLAVDARVPMGDARLV